jgi:hypothetical protein
MHKLSDLKKIEMWISSFFCYNIEEDVQRFSVTLSLVSCKKWNQIFSTKIITLKRVKNKAVHYK